MRIRIKKVRDDIPTPGYAYTQDAGYDLIAAEDILLQPGATVKIPTGLAFEIAEGYQMEIRPRSGVTSKSSIRGQLGTIDASYRGEVSVICDNIAQEYRNSDFAVVLGHSYRADGSEVPAELNKYAHGTHIIRKGDKIAQGVITPVVQATFVEVDELSETSRGEIVMKKIIAYAAFLVFYFAYLSVADIDSLGEASLLILTITSAQVFTIIGREVKK